MRVVLTGAESTGKSWLTQQLASHYQTIALPEFARQYVTQLNRPYTLQDVIKLAEKQKRMEEALDAGGHKLVFLDTSFIILKVWLEVVYNQCPQWINDYIAGLHQNLWLLCHTDLPWVADPCRENGGPMREALHNRYRELLIAYGFNWFLISGHDNIRLQNAIFVVDKHMEQQKHVKR